MTAWIKWATALLALVGLIWGGSWSLDERYARAMDVQAQVGEVKLLYLESERRALRKELFEWKSLQDSGGNLTTRERARLKEVEDELADVQEKINKLKGK